MINLQMVLSSIIMFLYIASCIAVLLGLNVRKRGGRETAFLLILLFLLAINLAVLIFFGIEAYSMFYPLIALVPLYAVSLLVSKYRGIKHLFVVLTAIVWASPLLLAANAVSLLFGGSMIVKSAVHIALVIPMLLILSRVFKPPLTYLLDNFQKGWSLFCAVPLLCVFVSFIQTRYRFTYDTGTFTQTGIWQFSLSFLSFLTYMLIVKYAGQIKEQLEAKGNFELVQTQLNGALQYISSLKNTQQLSATHYHDLRHHLQYIHTLAAEGSQKEIMRYVSEIGNNVDTAAPAALCKNETVNLILSAFHGKAEKQDIQLEIKADIPETLNLPDTDLCAIISNALENAIHAANQVIDRPRVVTFSCHTRNEQLFLEITNPFEGEVEIENGEVKSVGESGGIGTKSIALIVKKHGGILNFEAQRGVFVVSIIL